MAERRMFAKKITESDAFLEMPSSTQCLYFHLSMNADDDGFVNNPKTIMRSTNSNDDDLKLLLVKKFIISFNTGVIVIKHWRLNNYLRSDRYKATEYQDELSTLKVKDNGSYTLGIPTGNQLDTNGIHRIGKDSIGKVSKEKEKEKKVNKQIKEINKRNKYGEYKHVLLTEEQHTRLINDYGENLIKEYICKLDEYIQISGKSYKDHNLVIRKWLEKDNKKKTEERKKMYESW